MLRTSGHMDNLLSSPRVACWSDLLVALRAAGFCGGVDCLDEDKVSQLPVISADPAQFADLEMDIRVERDAQFLYLAETHLAAYQGTPIYRTLLPHISFSGKNLTPLWVNAAGRAVAAHYLTERHRAFIVGLDAFQEIIRYRQGDPARVELATNKAKWGFAFERPNYLFDGQVVEGYETIPWCDRLVFFLAECLSRLTGLPLVHPLPHGSKGVILLTGDCDQAYLEKYEQQLAVIEDFPITYFLVPQTRHTSETLARMPDNVQIGLHPDALEEPDNYDALCAEQKRYISELSGHRLTAVRNHGYLNRGYLGHLQAWERNGLEIDVNYPGLDGTALNGSFLAMRVYRPDHTWSTHYSLLTAFGDGMMSLCNITEEEACERIETVARLIESSRPGTIVLNFHPQNIDSTMTLHRKVLSFRRRPDWSATTIETYLTFLQAVGELSIIREGGVVKIRSNRVVPPLTLRVPQPHGWMTRQISPFHGELTLAP